MYDARLFEFIKKARGEGQTDTQIQERLKNSGWSNQAIADAFGGKLPYDPNSTKPRAKGVRLFKNIILLIGGFGAIVLALLVALIPLVLFSLNAARAQARDTRRISDISLLRNAINAFHIQYGTYPEGQGPLSTGVLDVLITEHMLEKIPTDPENIFISIAQIQIDTLLFLAQRLNKKI